MVTGIRQKNKIVMRIWEHFRNTFKRDVTKMKKQEMDKMVDRRINLLDKVANKKAKLKGYSMSQARMERNKLKGMRKGILKRGLFSEMKKLKTMEVKSYTRKGKTIRGYARGRHTWTPTQKAFIVRHRNVKTGKLRTMLEVKFKMGFSYSSTTTMKSRLLR